MRSVFAKTEQRDAILGVPPVLVSAMLLNVSISGRFSLLACWSRKLPVPAAQEVFDL
jgi:hypothetical protein